MTNDQAKKEHEAKCIENWIPLIRKFNKMWKDGEQKEAFTKFEEAVKSTHPLTFRQLDALITRCNNVLNGTYGQSKTQANLNYQNKS